jgi:hypothetical protein
MDNIPDVEKERARQWLEDYFKDVAEGKTCTVLFTTDGEQRHMFTSAHPLPDKYLKQWKADCNRLDIDLSLKK